MSADNSAGQNSFVFVLDAINVEGDLPVEVAPGHFFQKADREQVARIKTTLMGVMPLVGMHLQAAMSAYECNTVNVGGDTPGSVRHVQDRLAEKDWRYWIISFLGTNSEIRKLSWAASLLQHDIELGFVLLGSGVSKGGGMVWHQTPLNTYFENLQFATSPPITIQAGELREIATNYRLIKQITPECERVKKALTEFEHLRLLPRASEIVIIGLQGYPFDSTSPNW